MIKLPALSSHFAQRGHSLIELLVAMAILGIVIPAFGILVAVSSQGKPQYQQRQTGQQLLFEASEALRAIRATGWANVSTLGTFYPAFADGEWSLVSGTETIGDFTRSIEVLPVRRSNDSTIVESGGIIDPSTKKVIITVSWQGIVPQSLVSESYITRFLENLKYEESTEAHFTTGVHTGTTAQNTVDGEIVLASGGDGQWCSPQHEVEAEIDLPLGGVGTGIDGVEGAIYATTGLNAAGISFAHIAVANTDPPELSIYSEFDTTHKSNDIFAEQDYAYLTTDTNSKEVLILDTSTTTVSIIGEFNADGNNAGLDVATSGNVGFVTLTNNYLRTFNLTSKAGSRPQLDAITVSGTPTALKLVGPYAVVGLGNTGSGNKVQIFDATDPSDLQLVSTTAFTGSPVVSVDTNGSGTRLYVLTQQNASGPELFILNSETKSGSLPQISTYELGAMDPRVVNVTPGNRVVIGGIGGDEYVVLDVDNELNIQLCGSMDLADGIVDVTTVLESDGDAYTYSLSPEGNGRIRIIEGGPGGGYAVSGWYESAPFDAGYSTAFNYSIVDATLPSGTSVEYQVAVAPAVDGSCVHDQYLFLGPGGSPDTFFVTEGTVPFGNYGDWYQNPGRCFKYKLFLETTDNTSTPVVNSVLVNYSP